MTGSESNRPTLWWARRMGRPLEGAPVDLLVEGIPQRTPVRKCQLVTSLPCTSVSPMEFNKLWGKIFVRALSESVCLCGVPPRSSGTELCPREAPGP